MRELKTGRCVEATEQPIDTASAAGAAFLDVLKVFAEFAPTYPRRERPLDGIAKTKAVEVTRAKAAGGRQMQDCLKLASEPPDH